MQTKSVNIYILPNCKIHIQAGNALEQGWRVGIGPTLGCQNIWTDKINSLLQVELPYWQDSHQWQLKLNTQFQYILNNQNALRIGWQYQKQNGRDWDQASLGYVRFSRLDQPNVPNQNKFTDQTSTIT